MIFRQFELSSFLGGARNLVLNWILLHNGRRFQLGVGGQGTVRLRLHGFSQGVTELREVNHCSGLQGQISSLSAAEAG